MIRFLASLNYSQLISGIVDLRQSSYCDEIIANDMI